MSLEDKLRDYPKQYELSDIHIRSNQPFAIRENGSIRTFPNDVITRTDIESYWKKCLDKAQFDYLTQNAFLINRVCIMREIFVKVFKM